MFRLMVGLFFLFILTVPSWAIDKDGLLREGYTQGRGDGNAEVWLKEAEGPERTITYCFVPKGKIGPNQYNWRIIVSVDQQEVWKNETGPMPDVGIGPSKTERGISCVTSSPLPQGKMVFRFWYRYWGL